MSAQGPTPIESSDLFDYALVRHVIGFVFRGVGRHRVLAGTVFASGLAVVIWWMVVAPRTWHVEAKLLASRSQVIRSLGNPRSTGTPFEDPTRAAEETVFARDNLLSLIKQTRLLEKLEARRGPFERARDGALAAIFGPPSAAEKLEDLADLLEKKLKVATDTQTVVISIDWPDADAAFQLVETAQQNFLEARHVTEMTAISDALSILQVHAAAQQVAVTEALQELERVREGRREGRAPARPVTLETTTEASATPAAPQGSTHAVVAPSPVANESELAQLKFLLHAKRRALQDLEDFRARRLLELNAQLLEQRVQYAEKHPTVVDTLQRIGAMNEPSPQIVQVQEEVRALLEEYRRKGGVAPDALVEPTVRPARPERVATPVAAANRISAQDLDDDPEVEFARNTLRVASATFEELTMRMDSARIEQDTARAAFKYRYSVVRPASLPRKPVAPNLPMVFLVGLSLSAALALLAGAGLEWRRGLLVEPWQVERALGVPVLSTLRPS
jgi:hypothetical protein